VNQNGRCPQARPVTAEGVRRSVPMSTPRTRHHGARVPSFDPHDPLVSSLYTTVRDGRPKSLPGSEGNPTWEMGPVPRPERFLLHSPHFLLLPPNTSRLCAFHSLIYGPALTDEPRNFFHTHNTMGHGCHVPERPARRGGRGEFGPGPPPSARVPLPVAGRSGLGHSWGKPRWVPYAA